MCALGANLCLRVRDFLQNVTILLLHLTFSLYVKFDRRSAISSLLGSAPCSRLLGVVLVPRGCLGIAPTPCGRSGVALAPRRSSGIASSPCWSSGIVPAPCRRSRTASTPCRCLRIVLIPCRRSRIVSAPCRRLGIVPVPCGCSRIAPTPRRHTTGSRVVGNGLVARAGTTCFHKFSDRNVATRGTISQKNGWEPSTSSKKGVLFDRKMLAINGYQLAVCVQLDSRAILCRVLDDTQVPLEPAARYNDCLGTKRIATTTEACTSAAHSAAVW